MSGLVAQRGISLEKIERYIGQYDLKKNFPIWTKYVPLQKII